MTVSAYTFSLIIPTYMRPERLAGCLQSLANLRPPPGGFEVIVVDDGSPQPLDLVVAPFRVSIHLTLLRQRNGGPALARITGPPWLVAIFGHSRTTIAAQSQTG